TSASLIVYGSKKAVESAAKLVAQLESQLDRVFEPVDLERPLPAEVLSALPRVEPLVTTTYDSAKRRLYLFGLPADVARLKAYIAQVENAESDEEESVYYFEVERSLPGSLSDYIQRAVPGAEISYDSSAKRYTIIGTPTEQLAVAKLITDAENSLPPEDETRFYDLKENVPDKFLDLLKERVKDLSTLERDENNPSVLRVVAKPWQHEKLADAIDVVKAEYPLQDANTFAAYPITQEVKSRFSQVESDFKKQNGSIKILEDSQKNVLAVWALPSQHAALKKLLDELASVESGEKDAAFLYSPKHVDAATLTTLLTDLHQNLKVTNDLVNKRLILRGSATVLADAKETLAAIDAPVDAVARSYRSFSVKGFYSYDGVGNYYSPANYIRDISLLVPAARVTYDYYNQAIVVWGTEEECAIVEKAVADLAGKQELNKKLLRWPVRRANYSALISQISAICPGAAPSYEPTSQSLIIRVNNEAALAEVKELLELLDPENTDEFTAVLEYYDAGAAPTPELVASLQSLAPNAAKIAIDAKNKQVCVIAKPAEHKIIAENIERLAKSFGSSDLRLIPYPVVGIDLQSLVVSMQTAYPGGTFQADARGNRLLARASLDDHVKISEEIERINGESLDGETSETSFAPRVQVYEVPTAGVAMQVRGVVTSLFPGAEMFGGNGYGGEQGQPVKITVLANGREQKSIAAVVEQLSAPGEDADYQFAIYPYGDLDEDAVDALVSNLAPNALSVTPIQQSGYGGRGGNQQRRYQMQQERRQRLGYNAPADAKLPFYRIDASSKTVAIFANDATHESISDALNKLLAIGGEGAKSETRVYRLAAPLGHQLQMAVVQFAPSVSAYAPS
ncbi:MAG: hypothetical protein HUK22_00055, partial [Thermoguttaceae bacterium]|nr:hypothetical protein [Thermoguttaceae bacterium]